MAAPEVHHLFHHPIADHSFSSDRRTLAVAKDNNVELYSKSGNKFTLKDELKGHDKTVTSVDIAANSGMIVTCSQGKVFVTAILPSLLTGYCRQKRLCLGTFANWLEANSRPSSNQPSCHIRQMVPLRKKVRCGFRRQSNCCLLF